MSQTPQIKQVDASNTNAINNFAATGQPVLLISNTSQYTQVYSDKGSGADEDLTIYRPTPSVIQGVTFYIIGDAAIGNYNGSSGSSDTVAVLNDDPSFPLLAPPVSYSQVWNDKGSHGDQDGSIWYPVPPDGYVSLGYVGQNGYDSPTPQNSPGIEKYRCVRKDYTSLLAATPTSIWTDEGSGAKEDVSLYAVPGMNNLFVAQGNYSPYAGQLYALRPN